MYTQPHLLRTDHNPQRRTVADKMSPMRLVPWAKNREDTLNEINRKMQRALEEALVKNIHLQEVRGRERRREGEGEKERETGREAERHADMRG